jgi:hypothetical protein
VESAHETIGKIPLPPWVTKCEKCDDGNINGNHCPECLGVGYHGVRLGPCTEPLGSHYGILVKRARWLNGRRIFNDKDNREDVEDEKRVIHDGHPPWTPQEVHDPREEQHE